MDIFAGPGGWEEALRLLGITDVLGIELDSSACATRRAAGHRTIEADVSVLEPKHVGGELGRIEGLIASPPCKAFSRAGNRDGIEHVEALQQAISAEDWMARPSDDPLVWLVLEVGRWADALRPTWIACEQVPEVLPIWQAYRGVLERWSYNAWCGTLTAEQYGVPQTRERSFLLAHRERRVGPPAPTHQRYESRSKGSGQMGFLLPCVSMAEALGWTSEARAGFPRLDDRGDSPDGYRERDWRDGDEPAFALTEKARSWTVELRGSNDRPKATSREPDEPAPTIAFGHAGPEWVVANGMNTMKHTRDVNDMVPYERSIDDPAPTIDAKVGGAWTVGPPGHRQPPHTWKDRVPEDVEEPESDQLVLNTGMAWQEGDGRAAAQTRELDAPAPTLSAKSGGQWVFERPATTIAGDERCWPPGHKINSDDERRLGPEEAADRYGDRRGSQAIKLSLRDALVLQSFRPDYPVQGTKTKCFEQVGNAICPRLAAHILAVVLGFPQPTEATFALPETEDRRQDLHGAPPRRGGNAWKEAAP